ncbi:hypothetical protein P5F04_15870 [Clostridium perfringens]|uniref:Fibroin light chain n=1 Tax=Ostrinia furnacalis TaxID=93504 RepID=V5UTC1_OSTFU|nr:fibroin light chain-like [Ostrinia furnacalis]AHB81536.1 fibroin light chain [Ostrinia furnacalis]MDK0628343.1 hypothetical protein [Clostridium perfringens]
MLPFVLVSLLVSGAFALPAVSVSQYNYNEIAPVADNGKLVSSYLSSNAFDLVDGGDTNIYILTIQQIINDLSNQPDPRSQALAVAQAIAVVGELASGIPGDACDASAFVNAYANAVRSGNNAGLRAALNRYLGRLAADIDRIAQLAVNPNALRSAVGPRGNCAGGGRTYQFEAAWAAINNGSNGLINEEYCAAKRLYSAFNARSNNVGAAVSAAAAAPVARAVQQALNPLSNFLRVVASGANPSSQAAAAKAALLRAGASIQL